jgi:hypothetical protein
VVLTAGGAIALSGGARVSTITAGAGDAGTVRVSSQGPLSLSDPGSGILVSATSTASGNAGSVTVTAPQIAVVAGAEISSTTAGTGAGGSVNVTTPGTLVLDGTGAIANTEIAASATGPQSGPGGSVTVAADALTVEGGARIASTTFGPGRAGDIDVTVAKGVTLSSSGPNGPSAITASAQSGSSGQAGQVVLMAGGAIALSDGAKASSSTRRRQWRHRASDGRRPADADRFRQRDHRFGVLDSERQCRVGDGDGTANHAAVGRRNLQHDSGYRHRGFGRCDDARRLAPQRRRRC